MFEAILRAIGGQFVSTLLDKASGLFELWLKKEISRAELEARLTQAMIETARAVEISHAETLRATYSAFLQAAATSPLLRVVWASVALSQLAVLLWHQAGIPAAVYFFGVKYPSSGTTVDWAYALVAGCIGLGPVVLRTGPAGFNPANWKALIGR